MSTNLIVEAAEARFSQELSGHSVRITYKPPMEDMFETLTHRVVFRFRHEADALATRVKEAIRASFPYPLQGINVDEWLWQPSKASPLGFMHNKPKAEQIYREGVPLAHGD